MKFRRRPKCAHCPFCCAAACEPCEFSDRRWRCAKHGGDSPRLECATCGAESAEMDQATYGRLL